MTCRRFASWAQGLALLATAASLVGQELRWQLPERGAAVYTRVLTVDDTSEPKGAWIPGVWGGEPQVAAVLAGELDEARQCMAEPAADPREFLARIALDLRSVRRGTGNLAVEAPDRFQPVQVEVEFGAVAADGTQTFEARIEPDAKAARAASTNPNVASLQGKLRGTRVIDRTKGLVSSFAGTAEFAVDYPAFQEGPEARPLRRQQLRIADAWTLDAVLAVDDAEFRGRVVDAIRRSIGYLRKELATRLERPFDTAGDPYHDMQPGELALVLLALKHSGEDSRDELIQRGYGELRKLVIQGTYQLSVAILAIEALYAPPGEWAELRAGRIKVPMPRLLTAEDQAITAEWAKTLLGNIDTTVDAAYLRRWHYGPSQSWDNSTTQYALLGLYGASLCGVDVSPQVWTAAINHWLQCGRSSGSAEFPRFTLQSDLLKGTRTRAGSAKVQPIGWGYHDGEATGSMTCAGISALSLCTSALRIQKKGNPKLLREADQAVRAGFVWLEQNFTVRRNPGPRGDWPNWHHYYLYGLERCCELNQIALLGERDWYLEGAVRLLGTQREDGSWAGWVNTAFALLFLKKTALPAITGR